MASPRAFAESQNVQLVGLIASLRSARFSEHTPLQTDADCRCAAYRRRFGSVKTGSRLTALIAQIAAQTRRNCG